MQRPLVLLGLVIAAMFVIYIPWHVATAAPHQEASNWNQRDRAVYVVSTMNLLHFKSGRLLTTTLAQKFGVTHYEVYADQQLADLYFIEPRRDNGSSIGAVAYEMGWVAPLSVSSAFDRLRVRHAPASAASAYRNDEKQLIGSFTSTVPS